MFYLVFLLLINFLCGLNLHSDPEDINIKENLVLVQVKLNNEVKENIEILAIDDKIFLPIKYLSVLSGINSKFDRQTKVFSFTDPAQGQTVLIEPTQKTIKVGDNLLDISANRVFWIQQSVSLLDEILISRELTEQLLDLKTEYKEDNLTLEVSVPRLFSSEFKRTQLTYKKLINDEDPDLVQPNPTKLNVRSIQSNYFTQAQLSRTTDPLTTQTEITLGNFLGLNVEGEAYGGTFRAGPSFVFSDKQIGFAGTRQSWSKKINDKFGIVVGDSYSQLNRLNVGGQIFGIKIGTPKNIGITQDTTVAWQGACLANSEVLLIINGQEIARQLCTNGKYQFGYVPRLVDVNNQYQVIQRNSDGNETLIRDDRFNYFGDLVPAKGRAWQIFGGTQPLELFNTQSNFSFSGEQANSRAEIIPRKALAGGQFQYGLTDRITLESIVTADYLIRDPGDPFLFNSSFLPISNDNRFINGETISLGVYARPKNNIGIRLGTALSNSNISAGANPGRAGVGHALSLDYDLRFKRCSSLGSIFYLSPEFYTPGSPSNNTIGGNFSLNSTIGKNNIRGSLFTSLTNLDKKSINGIQQRNSIAINHAYQVNSRISFQNNFVYREVKNDFTNFNTASYRAFMLNNINKRFTATASYFLQNSKNLTPVLSTKFFGEATLGGIFFLDKKRRNQFRLSFALNTDNQIRTFAQWMIRYKNLIYQPSISVETNPGGRRGYQMRQGLFWQTTGSSRVGLEYTLSTLQSQNQNFDQFGGIAISGRNKSVNQTLSLNVQTMLGFLGAKPRILTSNQTGYVKGKAFIDGNLNGKYDNGEQILNKIQMQVDGKNINESKKGEMLALDLGKGIHKVSLKPDSFPITLNLVKDFINVKVEPGKTTEVNFPLRLSGATIEGRVVLAGIDGKTKGASNIIVVAADSTGKEVTYSYTDSEGYYVLSEVMPGNYSIYIDKNDLANRKLLLSQSPDKVTIPIDLENIINVKGINFEAKGNIFGV
jgi:hypothetical protein